MQQPRPASHSLCLRGPGSRRYRAAAGPAPAMTEPGGGSRPRLRSRCRRKLRPAGRALPAVTIVSGATARPQVRHPAPSQAQVEPRPLAHATTGATSSLIRVRVHEAAAVTSFRGAPTAQAPPPRPRAGVSSTFHQNQEPEGPACRRGHSWRVRWVRCACARVCPFKNYIAKYVPK